MKVFLKKKVRQDPFIKGMQAQQSRNEEKTARVAAVLASVNQKNYTVLGKAESDSGGDGYEIRMGSNHAVFCTCKGWQYSKNGTCKHLERFKVQVKPFRVKAT